MVSYDLREHDLTSDVFIREADNQSVLVGEIFVLVLSDETFARVIIGLTFPAAPELHLKPPHVSFGLLALENSHSYVVNK